MAWFRMSNQLRKNSLRSRLSQEHSGKPSMRGSAGKRILDADASDPLAGIQIFG
jgi:hypothetical protein